MNHSIKDMFLFAKLIDKKLRKETNYAKNATKYATSWYGTYAYS